MEFYIKKYNYEVLSLKWSQRDRHELKEVAKENNNKYLQKLFHIYLKEMPFSMFSMFFLFHKEAYIFSSSDYFLGF